MAKLSVDWSYNPETNVVRIEDTSDRCCEECGGRIDMNAEEVKAFAEYLAKTLPAQRNGYFRNLIAEKEKELAALRKQLAALRKQLGEPTDYRLL